MVLLVVLVDRFFVFFLFNTRVQDKPMARPGRSVYTVLVYAFWCRRRIITMTVIITMIVTMMPLSLQRDIQDYTLLSIAVLLRSQYSGPASTVNQD